MEFVSNFLTILLFTCWIQAARGAKVCYKPFGCFSDDWPFEHYLMTNPQSPSEIETFFTIHTRNESLSFHNFSNESMESVSRLVNENNLKVIIHGMIETSSKKWVSDMTRQLLKKAQTNVLVMDWGQGAYSLAAGGNARLVGAQVAYLLRNLFERSQVLHENVHIIGFSLGAHAAGYAGKKLRKDGYKLGRITGLDPGDLPVGGRIFETSHPSARLDLTDADFVDVIHTDTGGLGIARPIGHVDFYPNGGSDQPGCGIFKRLNALANVKSTENFFRTVGCNHIKAVDLFTNSMSKLSCQYHGRPCRSFDAFKRGECEGKCTGGKCPVMGYNAKYKKQLIGKKLYLETKHCNKSEQMKKPEQKKKITTLKQFWDNLSSLFG